MERSVPSLGNNMPVFDDRMILVKFSFAPASISNSFCENLTRNLRMFFSLLLLLWDGKLRANCEFLDHCSLKRPDERIKIAKTFALRSTSFAFRMALGAVAPFERIGGSRKSRANPV
jgi:hypothetical protein